MLFIMWFFLGLFFIGEGICGIYNKRLLFWGFSTKGTKFPIDESKRKAHNKALGKLWCVYGLGIMLLGVTWLTEQQFSLLFCFVGVTLESIVFAIIYTIGIEKKYRKR